MGCKWIVANFPVDKYKLSGEDLEDRQLKIKKELGELIEFINFGVNKRIIRLEGRASETGPPSDPRAESRSSVEYNLDLSKKRALEVARELRRLGLTYHIPIAPLGQTRPLPVSATGRFPRPGEENGQNRSVVIFYRKPPIAIARILPADHVHPPSWSGEFSYWRVTIGSNRTQVHVVLDGTKSQPGRTPVEGDYNYRTPLENKSEPPSIKEYKWEQLESNNERRVRDSILKWNEVDQPTTTVAIERNRVSAGSRLRFRLTVKDDQNLEASDTITIYMDISQQPAQQREPPVRRKANWGLKMRGSISLDAFRIGLRGRVGPVTPGIQARVGGLFAVGQLKYVPDDRVVTIAFIGGGVKAAAGIGIGGNPAGPYRECVRSENKGDIGFWRREHRRSKRRLYAFLLSCT